MEKSRMKRAALSARDAAKRMIRGIADRKKLIKGAAAVITIAAALVFFGANGEESPIEFIDSGEDIRVFAQEIEMKPEKNALLKQDETELIVCDIGGAVNLPGVYSLPEGSRVCDLIEMAGGASDDADMSCVNRAVILSDGAMIRIPASGENASAEAGSGSGWYSGYVTEPGSELVNINTAGTEELQSIPGIGPSLAGRIIDRRETAGPFRSIEDIKAVKGIGDKTFEIIKDFICC